MNASSDATVFDIGGSVFRCFWSAFFSSIDVSFKRRCWNWEIKLANVQSVVFHKDHLFI